MDFTHYTDSSIAAAAALVNTLDAVSGEDALSEPEAVSQLLADLNFTVGPASVTDVRELGAVRRRLRDVFEAGDEGTAAALTNAYLAELDVLPYLTDHDGHWHFHYVSEDAPLARKVASITTMGLATLLADQGFSRLGICDATDCRDVYIDTSRNRSRRYCSDGCSSRMNVAAYRARQKQQA